MTGRVLNLMKIHDRLDRFEQLNTYVPTNYIGKQSQTSCRDNLQH